MSALFLVYLVPFLFYFAIFFTLVILLFKIVLQHNAEVLSGVSKHMRTMMSFTENTHVFNFVQVQL
jgi:hypothetical protein